MAASSTPSRSVQAAALTAPYESQLVAQFHRELGRSDVERRQDLVIWQHLRAAWAAYRQPSDDDGLKAQRLGNVKTLLDTSLTLPTTSAALNVVSNAQNPLDHLVGDLVAQTSTGRYFVIEFKRYATGFIDETSLDGGGKPDRIALIGHLERDATCKELSLRGHFGAYWSESVLHLARYFRLARGDLAKSFSTSTLFGAQDRDDLWWSAEQFREYLECMTSHGFHLTDGGGATVFGYLDKEGEVVTMVEPARMFELVALALSKAAAMPAIPAANATTKRKP